MVRKLSLILAILFLVVGGLPPASVAAQETTAQYPDLRTLPPTDLRYDTVTIDGAKRQVLRFSNRVWNAGQGPLDLRGISSVYSETTTVYQRVLDSSGALVTQHMVGKFTYHPQHDHWHFGDFSDFELWTKATYDSWLTSGRTKGTPYRRSPKTTSCVMDTNRVQNLPNTPATPAYGTVCGTKTQGLSVGWADLYGYWLYGQWVDLGTSRLANGQYVLRSAADPLNRLYESADKADARREGPPSNEAETYFEVVNGVIKLDTVAPSTSIPVARPALNSTVRPDSVPVRLNWTAGDALSGVATYQVQQSVSGGTFATVATTGVKTSLHYLVPGKQYQFRLRARDRAGNWSAWKAAPSFVPVARQEVSAVYTGAWTTSKETTAYGGQLNQSSIKDAVAQFSFTGSRIGLISTKAPDRGYAEILVDAVRVGVVNLYAPAHQPRMVVFIRDVKYGNHVLTVRVLGTKQSASTGTRVDVDGFYFLP